MSNPDLVRLNNISLKFGQKTVLDQVNLALHDDCITTLIGPNGAGKSTLVRVILGLQKPSKGTIWRKPGLTLGYMPQKLHIEPTLPLSVERFLNLTGTFSTEQVMQTLESVKASHLLKASYLDLSGGETQRVLLARALLRNPDLLVLDEPVQGVDLSGQTELYRLISSIRKERGCSVLMISHDLHLVMSATDHVICLNTHICCSGHPESVSAHPEYIQLFGAAEASTLALYNHHHNHQHDLHGDVISECCSEHEEKTGA